MERIAQFSKVSSAQFEKDWIAIWGGTREKAQAIYNSVKIPCRATAGSAGYDFFAPDEIILKPGCTAIIPTGIRVRMEAGWVLMLFPRSGLGFRYRLQLDNTVGVIDADYFSADNEGHIQIKITNDTQDEKTLTIGEGDGIVQGVFLPFGITQDDHAQAKRTGGFGSTTR